MNISQTTAVNALDVVDMIVANARLTLSMASESDATRDDVNSAVVATRGMLKGMLDVVEFALYNDLWNDDLDDIARGIKNLIRECDDKLAEITGWEN